MIESLGWGALAAHWLVVGAVLALVRTWSPRVVGLVLGFGAGALIASVSFELAEEGLRIGSAYAVAIGLALGGLTYFAADRLVERWGGRKGGSSAGAPLAVGALLDGIPEQAVLGIGIAAGGGVSVALMVAIFASNLPEAIGSASDMRSGGRSAKSIVGLWAVVAAFCAAATVGGAALSDVVSSEGQAFIDGFAAGALLTMLIDSMGPGGQGEGEGLRRARDGGRVRARRRPVAARRLNVHFAVPWNDVAFLPSPHSSFLRGGSHERRRPRPVRRRAPRRAGAAPERGAVHAAGRRERPGGRHARPGAHRAPAARSAGVRPHGLHRGSGFILAFGIAKAVANYFAGTWSDRFGRKPVLVAGWLVAVPVPLLLIWAPSWTWVIVANVLLGISQGLMPAPPTRPPSPSSTPRRPTTPTCR